MIANINPETGIRYGVVSMSSLEDWVWDEFLNNGRNLSAEQYESDYRAEHGLSDRDELPEGFWDWYESDEDEYELQTDEMKLGLSYLGGAEMVWVFESPVTATCRLCSPCVPNAGDLDSPDPDGLTAYSLPVDWFRSED